MCRHPSLVIALALIPACFSPNQMDPIAETEGGEATGATSETAATAVRLSPGRAPPGRALPGRPPAAARRFQQMPPEPIRGTPRTPKPWRKAAPGAGLRRSTGRVWHRGVLASDSTVERATQEPSPTVSLLDDIGVEAGGGKREIELSADGIVVSGGPSDGAYARLIPFDGAQRWTYLPTLPDRAECRS